MANELKKNEIKELQLFVTSCIATSTLDKNLRKLGIKSLEKLVNMIK